MQHAFKQTPFGSLTCSVKVNLVNSRHTIETQCHSQGLPRRSKHYVLEMRVNEYTENRKELKKIPRLFNKEIPMCKITPKLSVP